MRNAQLGMEVHELVALLETKFPPELQGLGSEADRFRRGAASRGRLLRPVQQQEDCLQQRRLARAVVPRGDQTNRSPPPVRRADRGGISSMPRKLRTSSLVSRKPGADRSVDMACFTPLRRDITSASAGRGGTIRRVPSSRSCGAPRRSLRRFRGSASEQPVPPAAPPRARRARAAAVVMDFS